MDHFPLIILAAVFILLACQYIMEVHGGSSTSTYDPESAATTENYPDKKSTSRQFLGRDAPIQLLAIGLPLLAYKVLLGIVLIGAALLLFGLCGIKLPGKAQYSFFL